ncbi:MAG: hypothetical protein PWR20_1651 [Bacteroidales bacterium]|jgi:PAS domain S-box-containing protein|nr:hypothetical protein [Bacteroidales bacterium]MDN5330591.1 hypothetical protein [Bacteroidales bacterium]
MFKIEDIIPGFSASDALLHSFSGTLTNKGQVIFQSNDLIKEINLKELMQGLPAEIRFRLLRKYIESSLAPELPCYVFFPLENTDNKLIVIIIRFFVLSRRAASPDIDFEGWILPSEISIEMLMSLLRDFRLVFTQSGKNILLVGPYGRLSEIIAWAPEDIKYLSGLRKKMLLSGAPKNFKPFAEFILSSSNHKVNRGEVITNDDEKFSATFVALQGMPVIGEGLGLVILTKILRDEQINQRLQSAEKLYQQLFELSPAGMLLEDARGFILYANQALLDSTGFTREEIIGKHVSIFAAPENLPHIEENIRRIVKGEKLDIIVESRRKNGTRYYSRLIETLITLADGQQAILSISVDITDRVLMQRQLEEEKEKYRRFFENVLDIFFVTTPHGTIRHISPSVEKYLGYTPAEIISQSAASFYLNPSDRNLFIDKLKEHQEVIDMEIPLITKSGAVRYFSLNAHGIYTSDGELQEVEGTFRDITEKKQYLAELEEARRKAEESAALKSSLLSNMSHEVRTPLNSILGFSQLLYHNHPDLAVKEVAQKIHASGERLLKTLEAIMLVAQLDSGLEPEPDNWPLDQALARVFLEYQSVTEEKGLLYLLEPEDDLWVYTDEKLLSICVKELIDNAVKFTKEGGITVRLKAIQSPQGPMARIEVRDTGIGIPPSKHELIFKEFRQASEGMSRSFEGLGLGLSIVRRLVHLLGGSLSFESSLGNGTVFYLDLPRIVEEGNFSEPMTEAPVIQQEKYIPKGLLVEDNSFNAEITKSFLEGYCPLDTAATFFEAMKMIQDNNYDFFLIDIALGPGPSGIEVLNEIRKMENFKNTPAIAVTGFAQHGDSSKLKSLGFTHYIAKPFTRDEIVSLLNMIFYNS